MTPDRDDDSIWAESWDEVYHREAMRPHAELLCFQQVCRLRRNELKDEAETIEAPARTLQTYVP